MIKPKIIFTLIMIFKIQQHQNKQKKLFLKEENKELKLITNYACYCGITDLFFKLLMN